MSSTLHADVFPVPDPVSPARAREPGALIDPTEELPRGAVETDAEEEHGQEGELVRAEGLAQADGAVR